MLSVVVPFHTAVRILFTKELFAFGD
jgi:hypothetical protein